MGYYFLCCKFDGKEISTGQPADGWYSTTLQTDFYNFPAILKIAKEHLEANHDVNVTNICIVNLHRISKKEYEQNKTRNNRPEDEV